MADDLKAELIASRLSRAQYLTLRNTARILRGSGVALDAEMENALNKFQAVIAAYEKQRRRKKGGPAC